jgi:hypothetical protein
MTSMVRLRQKGMDADELRAAMRDAGIPEEQIEQVVTTLAPTLPEDAIRQKEAEEKYGILHNTLSTLVARKQVRQYAVLSHKLRYVSEDDIRAWMERRRARSA